MLNRKLDLHDVESFDIFHNKDIVLIDSLKIPELVRFFRADKFDSKFILTNDDFWVFNYSGGRNHLNFSKLNKYEKKLAKYFLVSYIQINTPSSLDEKLSAFNYLLRKLKEERLKISYINLKKILIQLANNQQGKYYYYLKFLTKILFLEGLTSFNQDLEYELEFITRPSSFNSNLYYQEYVDPIDYPLVSMIQKGFNELHYTLLHNDKSISSQTLLYSSILGLVYTTGLRPVQLSKLSVEDIQRDTRRETDQFSRYSVLIPYAKQARFVHARIAVKLPEEIAEIIFKYIDRFQLIPGGRLFDLGDKADQFCSQVINTQLYEFSPLSYKEAVLKGEMIQQKYSYSDFRHHVGYSLAMAGSTAEEIAYILGHSSTVTARHYIFSTPQLAQIRAQALGSNALYKQMIAMLLTGRLVNKKDWKDKKVIGNIGNKIHFDIGGCAYKDKCLLQPVRNCYGCMYFHPFIDADHSQVLESIQEEINDVIKLSDGIGISKNPLIRIHEATKFEIESVIARCSLANKENCNEF
ncbi:site-specific integrase [Acinetobacter sp. YH12035]|uniref:site-specific integrase n=1 Tax=Acinetobacter sp. YH12035 TaxID=2601045 RepID=UPI0015D21609|nr:site-specific integrase [Acinetobacter sp. YH12035]